MFIVYCNAAALPMYRLLICYSSTQCTALQIHHLCSTAMQKSAQRRKYDHCNLTQHSCSGLCTQLTACFTVSYCCIGHNVWYLNKLTFINWQLVIILPSNWICKKYFVHTHYVYLKASTEEEKMGGGMRLLIMKWTLNCTEQCS